MHLYKMLKYLAYRAEDSSLSLEINIIGQVNVHINNSKHLQSTLNPKKTMNKGLFSILIVWIFWIDAIL